MSYPAISSMLKQQGYNIHVGTLYTYAKRLGFGRTCSEAKRNRLIDQIDWNKSFLTEEIIEDIDGFLLGDGGLGFDKRNGNDILSARLACGVEHKEFCALMMNLFSVYRSTYTQQKHTNMNQGLTTVRKNAPESTGICRN